MARSGFLPLLLVCLSVGAALADTTPPAQCDPSTILIPGDLSILGPEMFLVAGGVRHSYHVILGSNATSPTRPLLLLHGMGATQYEWPPAFLAWLADAAGRPIVTLDHAGLGGSQVLDGTAISITGLAASTAAFLSALTQADPSTFLPTADVLGYSMGGMVAQTLAAVHPEIVHAVISVAGSPGSPSAPQPSGGIQTVLTELMEAQLGVGTANLTLFFHLGDADLAYCSMWNAVASLQYALGQLPLPGAGYALGTIVSDPASLVKSQAAVQAQVDAISAFYVGSCPSGWPVKLESVCPRSTAAWDALGRSPVPIAFLGGAHDVVIPYLTQTVSASKSLDYVIEDNLAAGHGIIYNFGEADVNTMVEFLASAQPIDSSSPSSAAPALVPHGSMFGLAAAAAATFATYWV